MSTFDNGHVKRIDHQGSRGAGGDSQFRSDGVDSIGWQGDDMSNYETLMRNPQANKVMSDPRKSDSDKVAVIKQVLGFTFEQAKDFLARVVAYSGGAGGGF